MPDHCRHPGEHRDELVAEPAAEERGRGALGDVEQGDREPELEAERPPDVRRAGFPLPTVRMSTPLTSFGSQ